MLWSPKDSRSKYGRYPFSLLDTVTDAEVCFTGTFQTVEAQVFQHIASPFHSFDVKQRQLSVTRFECRWVCYP